MSGGNNTKKQLIEKINELMVTLQEKNEAHANEISLYRKTFEEQKQEMKENHENEISLYREIINDKKNEIKNLMLVIEKNEELLKEKDKIHKHEREERERTYKRETDLLQQTIDRLEQTIRSFQIDENKCPTLLKTEFNSNDKLDQKMDKLVTA
ncbi:1056_t:CDS:2, partial [Racocetra fulgida]